jgi:hypothetical protein
MASEDSGAEFPPHPVEVKHWEDTNVKTPEEPKLEDLVGANQNPFVPLESRPSSKSDAASAEAAMKSLDLKVSALLQLLCSPFRNEMYDHSPWFGVDFWRHCACRTRVHP